MAASASVNVRGTVLPPTGAVGVVMDIRDLPPDPCALASGALRGTATDGGDVVRAVVVPAGVAAPAREDSVGVGCGGVVCASTDGIAVGAAARPKPRLNIRP